MISGWLVSADNWWMFAGGILLAAGATGAVAAAIKINYQEPKAK